MTPVRLRKRFLEKIWGSFSLAPFYPDRGERIGEVWFEADETLPLLVKFIFTSEKLSVQVHPGDEYARLHEHSPGKTEMWYVVRAAPGASLAVGFQRPVSKERLIEASLTGEIEQVLRWWEVAEGDTFLLPAGTVHAIGPGLVIAEIQQPSDVTYRLYDYGRGRELHLKKAADVAHLGTHPGKQAPVRGGNAVVLAECAYFRTELWKLDGRRDVPGVEGSGQFLIFLEGSGRIGGEEFSAGEAFVLGPEGAPIEPVASARFLRASVPAH